MPISTAGVAERDGTFLLALRKPGTSIGESWEFPGGKVEEGETPRQALAREYAEEFHIKISVGEQICSGSFSNKGTEYTLLAFAVELEDGNLVLTEHQKVHWFRLEDLDRNTLAPSDMIILNHLLSAR